MMMSSDPLSLATLAVSGLAALSIVSLSALRGWSGWLALRRIELAARPVTGEGGGGPMSARIELADLRERIRKLEAIAAGVDP